MACIIIYLWESTHIDAHFHNRQLNKRTHPQRKTPQQGPAQPEEQQRSGFERKTSFLCFDPTRSLQMLSSPSFIKLLAHQSGGLLPLNSQWAACHFFLPSNFPGCCFCGDDLSNFRFQFWGQTSKNPLKPIPSVVLVQSMRLRRYLCCNISPWC